MVATICAPVSLRRSQLCFTRFIIARNPNSFFLTPLLSRYGATEEESIETAAAKYDSKVYSRDARACFLLADGILSSERERERTLGLCISS